MSEQTMEFTKSHPTTIQLPSVAQQQSHGNLNNDTVNDDGGVDEVRPEVDSDEWAQQPQLTRVEEERDQYKERCDALELQQAELQSQMKHARLQYEEITTEKERLSHQFSRQLAEIEYTKIEAQRELQTYKLQLRAQESSSTMDTEERDLLESRVSSLKNERNVFMKQRDLFVVELETILKKYERLVQIDEEKDELIKQLESKLTAATSQVTSLQKEIHTMVNERDNSELKLLKQQIEEMNQRLERSERQNHENKRRLSDQAHLIQKNAAARKEQLETNTTLISTVTSTATNLLTTSQTASVATSAVLQQTIEKASKKRKEREQELILQPLTAIPDEGEINEPNEEDVMEEDEPATKKKKSTKKSTNKKSETTATAEVVEKKTIKRKKKRSDEEDEKDNEDDEEWKEAEDEVNAIAGKWNVKLNQTGAAPTWKSLTSLPTPIPPPAPMPSKGVSSRPTTTAAPTTRPPSSSLTGLTLSPIARHPEPICPNSDFHDQLAQDAAALANSTHTSLNDSTGSLDSSTGERRRKLFPTKLRDKSKWTTPTDPVVIKMNEPTTSRPPLQSTTLPQPSAALSSITSSFINPLHKSLSLPPSTHRNLVGLPPPTATSTRNLFMHFLGGAMKAPKLKQTS